MLIKEIDYWNIFDAYDWQRDLFRAFFSGEYDNYILCIHRRAGKDFAYWNLAWLTAAMQSGNFLYTLPKIAQARNVIWQGTMLDGRRWIDLIPKHLLAKEPNNTERKIYFTSGSVLTVTGADSILGSHLGSNLHGIFMSEFQRQSPSVYDYLRPIVKRTNGFFCCNFTAYGKNHAWKLMQDNKDNPRWYCKTLTVDDTTDNKGRPIFSKEQIQEELDSGMDQELVQQEYYCNFDIAIKGVYFGENMDLARSEGRIVKDLEIYPNLPVHTSWDLGQRDANVIWFFQVIGSGDNQQFRYFYEHTSNYKDIDYYVKLLYKIREQYGFSHYSHHFMPHDVKVSEWSTGKSRHVMLMQAGINVSHVPLMRVMERVQVARSQLKNCYFSEQGCKNGIEALANYRSKLDKQGNILGEELHDWTSHSASAFCYGHVGWLESYNKPRLQQQKTFAKYRPLS